ncbi:MAG TPA: hypothetical protein VGO07_05050 [Candidatus Saccharimonadales bacterium]|jgi:hypothetical protein|nr:hypothetical protein [Candidatus Saccharimonadales bacterium]
MPHDLILIVAIAVPVLAMTILRVNAAMVFLSLALGTMLVQFLAPFAKDLTNIITPRTGSVSDSTITLGFLLAPAIITAIFTVLSVSGRVKVMVNALPAAASGLLAVLLAVPLLPKNLSAGLESQHAWHILSNAQPLVVGVGAVMSLLFLWTQRSSSKHHEKHRH